MRRRRKCDALRDPAGIECFGIDGNQGWRGYANGVKEERRGYETEADALRAALMWRLEMAKKDEAGNDN